MTTDASTAPAARLSRIITPAFAHCSVLVSEVTWGDRSITIERDIGKIEGVCVAPDIAPAPLTVKTPPAYALLPAVPTAPMSPSAHGLGSAVVLASVVALAVFDGFDGPAALLARTR